MKKNILFIFLLISNWSSAQLDTLVADSLYQSGKDLYYNGYYKNAKEDFHSALSIWQKTNDEDHEKVMKIYMRLGKSYRHMRYHQIAIDHYEKGVEIAKKILGENAEYVGGFYMDIALVYKQKYQLEKSNFYNKKALKIFKKIKGEESLLVADLIANMGTNMDKMKNFREAEKYYNQALEIFKKSAKPNSKYFNRIYLNLSSMNRRKGDFGAALDYGRKALEIKLLNYNPTHPSVPKYYYNLSRVYSEQGKYEEGLSFMKKAVELEEASMDQEHPELGGSYGSLGHFYMNMGEPQKALELFWKGIKIIEKRLDSSHPYLVAGYDNIGAIYENEKDYDQALGFYKIALGKNQSNPSIPRVLKVRTHRKIGNIFIKKNNLDSAFLHIGLALENIANDFKYEVGNDAPNPSLEQVQLNLDFLDILKIKTKAYEKRFENNNTITSLESGLKTIKVAVALIEKIRRSYQSEETRRQFNEEVTSVFKTGVRISFQLWELTDDPDYLLQALQFSEKSKASILWQNMNANFALENSGIPTEKLSELEVLSAQIEESEEEYYEAKNSDKEKIANDIFDLKRDYETKVAALEEYNPAYFALKHAVPEIDFKKLSEKTADGSTAFVEYFYDKNNIYIFVISNGKLKAHKESYSKKMDASIQYLRDFKIGEFAKNQTLQNQNYIARLNLLHKNLILPIYNEISQANELIFIPHGVLNYLSFEMLTHDSETKDFRELPYLLKRHNIQYIWSLAFFEKNKIKQNNYKYDYLGFAPLFENSISENNASNLLASRSNLSTLNFTKLEIENAKSYFDGNIFLDHDASEISFQQYAPESKIIHLATHAIANDQQPMQSGLLFSNQKDTLEDGYLNAYEIYNMNLPAALAVMSACNTGYGQLAEGEGVISLGRAFSYAGCKSVMMSLWMANDQSTASLMDNFYQNLAKGERKDLALKNAKLQYLENADPLTAHPFFWAGIVAVGDMQPLQSGSGNLIWILGIGIVGVLLFFVWCSRSPRSRRGSSLGV